MFVLEEGIVIVPIETPRSSFFRNCSHSRPLVGAFGYENNVKLLFRALGNPSDVRLDNVMEWFNAASTDLTLVHLFNLQP